MLLNTLFFELSYFYTSSDIRVLNKHLRKIIVFRSHTIYNTG